MNTRHTIFETAVTVVVFLVVLSMVGAGVAVASPTMKSPSDGPVGPGPMEHVASDTTVSELESLSAELNASGSDNESDGPDRAPHRDDDSGEVGTSTGNSTKVRNANTETVYVGSEDGTVYAVDAASGGIQWTFTEPSRAIRSSPTVVEGTVYVGSFDGNVYAVDAVTGDKEWAASATTSSAGVFSSPTVVDGTVYVGSNDGALYAFDAETGTQQWGYTTPTERVSSSPTVVDDTVYVGSSDGTLYAVDAATGDGEWTFTAPSDGIVSSPTVHDGTVYVGSYNDTLYAVDADTGTQQWAFTTPSSDIFSSPTIADGTVYVGSTDGTLYAVDAATGDGEWTFTAPSEAIFSSPTVYDGTVYVGSEDGVLWAVDATTGSQDWAFTQPDNGVGSSPTVFDDTVYIGTLNLSNAEGNLYAVDANTGYLQWSYDGPDGVFSSPTVVTNPDTGASVDTRVLYRTLGHHDGVSSGSGLDVTITQITRSEFPEVTAYAEVRDQNGNPVSGLDASDFTIREDSRVETIESVDTIGSGPGQDVSISLAIDRSGSMGQETRFDDAKAAADNFVDQLEADDEAAIIEFDRVVEIGQRWTRDKAALTNHIEAMEIHSATSGDTALWAATIEGVEEATPRQGRSAVVVLTDGRNNEPPSDVQEAIDAAQQAGVPVYTIGLGSPSNINEADLQRLADETGGAYYHAPDSSDLADIYADISARLDEEYVITYETSDTSTDGSTRRVSLTATASGQTGSDVGSYVAPCAPLPDAAFEMSPTSPAVGQEVTFDGSPSSANGGDIVAYYWDFNNDGQVDARGETVSHSFAAEGTYEVKLTVEKTCGASDSIVETVTVSDSGDGLELSTSGDTARPDGEATVNFQITNTGSSVRAAILDIREIPSGWSIVDRKDDGGEWQSADAKWLWPTISPGESVNPWITLSVPDGTREGDYTLFAVLSDYNGEVVQREITVTVDKGGVLDRYDENENGLINDPEVLAAINDWRNGNLDDSKILKVIRYWRSQDQFPT